MKNLHLHRKYFIGELASHLFFSQMSLFTQQIFSRNFHSEFIFAWNDPMSRKLKLISVLYAKQNYCNHNHVLIKKIKFRVKFNGKFTFRQLRF